MKRLFAAMVATVLAGPAMAEFPEKEITLVVPSAPGGSGDRVARTLSKYNREIKAFDQEITVKNSRGGGGSVASRQVKEADPDGYTILLLHQGLITANVLGVTDYGPEAFEPLAEVAQQCLVYVGAPKSPYADYKAAVEAVKGGTRMREAANIGAPAHFASMYLNEVAGINVSLVQAGQGSERLASLMGGHTDVSIFAVSEALAYQENGLKPLVIMSAERDPVLPDVPTARELGYDAEFCIGNWILAPKGTPDDVLAKLQQGLETLMTDPALVKEMTEGGFKPVFVSGDMLADKIDAATDTITRLGAKIAK